MRLQQKSGLPLLSSFMYTYPTTAIDRFRESSKQFQASDCRWYAAVYCCTSTTHRWGSSVGRRTETTWHWRDSVTPTVRTLATRCTIRRSVVARILTGEIDHPEVVDEHWRITCDSFLWQIVMQVMHINVLMYYYNVLAYQWRYG